MNMQFTPDQVQTLLDGQIKLLDVLERRRKHLFGIKLGLPKTDEEAQSSPLFDFISHTALDGLLGTFIEAIDQEVTDRQKGVDQMRQDLAAMKSRVVAPGQGVGALFQNNRR